MKFSMLAALAFAIPAFCQSVEIIDPSANTSIAPGETFDVTVLQPGFSQGFTNVGIAISLASCRNISPCPDMSTSLGDVLFHGALNPTTPIAPKNTAVYQNFTVTAPSTFAKGLASLNVVQFLLTGAGPAPAYDVVSIPVNVE